MRIEHIAFMVAEPLLAAKWYEANLGLRVVRAQLVSPFMHFLADDQGRTVVEIYNNPLTTVPDYSKVHPLHFHVALSSSDVQADRARLIKAGATMEGEPTLTPGGVVLAFLRDPWGVPLQLVQRAVPLV